MAYLHGGVTTLAQPHCTTSEIGSTSVACLYYNTYICITDNRQKLDQTKWSNL